MAISKQSRNILIGSAVAIIIIAILAFLLGRGCEEETATTATTPTTTTDTTATVPTETVTVPTVPEPEPEPEPSPLPEIMSRSVDPEVADPGDPLTFSAEVSGAAESVTINVYAISSGDLALTLPLIEGATVEGITNWSATAGAPATKGAYRYYASALAADGSVVEMPGVSGWTFCIGDPLVDCS